MDKVAKMNSQVLIELLRDERNYRRVNMSCQLGIVERCLCILCRDLRIDEALATPAPAPIPDAGELVEVSQFLTAVMDAAGLVRHGRQSKELSEYLGKECARLRHRIVSALQASAMVVPDGWIAVSDRLPEVPEGENWEVIVCVKRAHNGESYVFSARYLNAFLLYNDDIDDESTTATGWHDVKEHSEYDGWYSKLIDDGSGDEVTHWMPLAASPAQGDSQ